MSYEEFKQLLQQGKVEVDPSAVSDVMDDLPKKERNAIIRWSSGGVVVVILGILILPTVSVVLGLLLIAGGGWWFSRKSKEAGQNVILGYAAANEAFFDSLVARGVLKAK